MRLTTFCLVLGFLVSASALAQPIGEALQEEQPDLIQLEVAIKNDPNPGHLTTRGASYLHLAARRNLGEHIRALMKVPEISKLFLWRNRARITPIEEAIIKNQFDAFKALLSYFKHVDGYRMHNIYGWSLMHLAAADGRVEMIIELHKASHALDTSDNGGWTPLMVANAKHQHAAAQKIRELMAAQNPPPQGPQVEAEEEAPEPEPFISDDEEQIGAAPLLQQTEAGIKPFIVSTLFAGCVWIACKRLL